MFTLFSKTCVLHFVAILLVSTSVIFALAANWLWVIPVKIKKTKEH